MAGNHGSSGVYEQGDQINYGRADIANEGKHHTMNAQGYRPKDQNRAMNQMLYENATMHGNEPSRGAKADADIQREEEELLKRKKDKTDSMPGKKF
ncbi:hypothetical protein F4814DRAFT_443985 [Daldinia grandis]|nr:hypothetical protein F4814DRAFT_443985 [Daldinia grandis]